jgi:hypothetical protein
MFLNIDKVAMPDKSQGVTLTVQIGLGESCPLQSRIVLTPENATAVGQALIERAHECTSGIIMPPSRGIVNPGSGS